MVRACIGVAVRNEHSVTAASDKTEVGYSVQGRRANGLIGQIHPAQRDGQGVRIVELDEIINIRKRARSKPLVNLQSGWVPKGLSLIDRAEGRFTEQPIAVVEPPD